MAGRGRDISSGREPSFLTASHQPLQPAPLPRSPAASRGRGYPALGGNAAAACGVLDLFSKAGEADEGM